MENKQTVTVEDFAEQLTTHLNINSGEIVISQKDAIKAMIEFAKIKLKEQQEAILENVGIEYYKKYWSSVSEEREHDQDENGVYTMEPCVDKQSIIDAYNIDEVK